MKIKLEKTDIGFKRGEFTDLYGSRCSIQESSLATINALWLGVDIGSPDYSDRKGAHMHIDQDMAAALIPLLKRFVKTGRLEKG